MTVPLLRTTQGRGVGVFGFGRFLGRFFGSCTKKLWFFGFCACYGFGFFPYFSIWFLVLGQNTRDFSDLVSNGVFGFDCLVSGFLNRESVRN